MAGFARSGAARLASSALIGALLGALVPIVALLLLEPAKYGAFSTIYLLFAYGVSLQYSVVSEAWARARRKYRKATAWANYSTALFVLAATVAIVAFLVSLLVPELQAVAGWLGAAVFLSVYRSGARYYWMSLGMVRRVICSDLFGIAAFVGAFILLRGSEPIVVLAIAWSLSALASAVGVGLPALHRGAGPLLWWRTHKREIGPLLSDSTLMDLGAIGAPFLLVGFMGAANFGLYRGIANAAMPVRLVLDPLRPALGRRPQAFFFGKSALWLIGITTLVVATACYVALEFLVSGFSIRLGTLSELSVFALPSATFAAASFVGTLYYIVCRTNSDRRTIMTGRICQTVVVMALPVLGFATLGLEGAIWGFAISASVSAVIWMMLAVPRAAQIGEAVWSQRIYPSRPSTTNGVNASKQRSR
jgi:O-antigen/teichoic acid export membrane protein